MHCASSHASIRRAGEASCLLLRFGASVQSGGSLQPCSSDEISMVAPEHLLQADVRVRQAKGPLRRFGGLGVGLLGDFLQLPPVDTHSLAEDIWVVANK